jgi:WD40 repeat protein
MCVSLELNMSRTRKTNTHTRNISEERSPMNRLTHLPLELEKKIMLYLGLRELVAVSEAWDTTKKLVTENQPWLSYKKTSNLSIATFILLRCINQQRMHSLEDIPNGHNTEPLNLARILLSGSRIEHSFHYNNHACVNAIAYSSNGKYCVTGENDGNVLVYHQKKNSEWDVSEQMQPRSCKVDQIKFTQSDTCFETSSHERRNLIWRLTGENDWIPKDKLFTNISYEHSYPSVHVFDTSPDHTAIIFRGPKDKYLSYAHLIPGEHIIKEVVFSSGSVSETFCVWIKDKNKGWVEKQKIIQLQKPVPKRTTCIRFSPDGESFITGSSSGSLHVWVKDKENHWRPSQRLIGFHKQGINHISFNPDGRHIMTTSYDRTSAIWKRRRFAFKKSPATQLQSNNTADSFSCELYRADTAEQVHDSRNSDTNDAHNKQEPGYQSGCTCLMM